MEPCLPNLLVLSNRLKDHEAALRPFLDSLPAPFEWRMIPRHLEEEAADFQYLKGQHDYSLYMRFAAEKKEEGNKAFAAKQGTEAVAAYEEAVRLLDKARIAIVEIDDESKKKLKNLHAICFANCSAARLLSGESRDPVQALACAKKAVVADEYYAKGCVAVSHIAGTTPGKR